MAWVGYFIGQEKMDDIVPVPNTATTTVIKSAISTTPVYTTYVNEKYNYSVEYEKQQEQEENIAFSKVSEKIQNIVTFRKYTDYYGDQPLGDISCTDTVHDEIAGLNVDMMLDEYANAIYKDKLDRGFASVQKAQPARGGLTKGTFADLEAYDFIIVENAFRPAHYVPFEVNRYIVTKNPRNNFCIIRYPEFDYSQENGIEMFVARRHWIESFHWARLE